MLFLLIKDKRKQQQERDHSACTTTIFAVFPPKGSLFRTKIPQRGRASGGDLPQRGRREPSWPYILCFLRLGDDFCLFPPKGSRTVQPGKARPLGRIPQRGRQEKYAVYNERIGDLRLYPPKGSRYFWIQNVWISSSYPPKGSLLSPLDPRLLLRPSVILMADAEDDSVIQSS